MTLNSFGFSPLGKGGTVGTNKVREAGGLYVPGKGEG